MIEEKNIQENYTYDDYQLKPSFSDIPSRSEISLSVKFHKNIKLELPVISSPMDSVSGPDMVATIGNHGGLGILHRFNSIEEQCQLVRDCQNLNSEYIGAAVGTIDDYFERAQELVKNGVTVICVDTAHGHHILMKNALTKLRNSLPNNIHVMAGNVATSEGFQALSDWGANSVRVGIGNGSICSSRINTGFGIPSVSAILDCASTNAYLNMHSLLIADGGIKYNGDIVKALAFGADCVMVGSLLAGTDESPGEINMVDGRLVKVYRGMSSRESQLDWRSKSSAPEGISTMIPYKGTVNDILADMVGNIRSGLSYCGARNIQQLRERAVFIRQTHAGVHESSTHILTRK